MAGELWGFEARAERAARGLPPRRVAVAGALVSLVQRFGHVYYHHVLEALARLLQVLPLLRHRRRREQEEMEEETPTPPREEEVALSILVDMRGGAYVTPSRSRTPRHHDEPTTVTRTRTRTRTRIRTPRHHDEPTIITRTLARTRTLLF